MILIFEERLNANVCKDDAKSRQKMQTKLIYVTLMHTWTS